MTDDAIDQIRERHASDVDRMTKAGGRLGFTDADIRAALKNSQSSLSVADIDTLLRRIDELTAELAAANQRAEQAATRERERIVAWLENEAMECDRLRGMAGPLPDGTEDMCFYGAGAYRHAADALSRPKPQEPPSA